MIKQKLKLILGKNFPTTYSKIIYRRAKHKKLNLKNPTEFDEKLMWLKLNEYKDNQLITQCADKYEVREYVKKCGCEEILNDLIGVYDSAEQINWKELPNQFVLKCNHGAGYNIICKNKDVMEEKKVKEQLDLWLKDDYSVRSAELQYKNIKRKIICEKFLDSEYEQIEDYKIYCFNGKPEFCMLCTERNTQKTKYMFFDKEWKLLRINKAGIEAEENYTADKPKTIDKMYHYAEILSKPFKFVRVDFYDYKDNVIFGELTFTPSACIDLNYTEEAQIMLGKKIKI